MFIIVVYFVMTQSGNFWIYPRRLESWKLDSSGWG